MPTTSINLIPQNGLASVIAINCGTSSPPLGGTIDVSAFPNLTSFNCNSNNITAISGYSNNTNLVTLFLINNKITGTIPSLMVGLINLENFRCDGNLLTGAIPSLSAFPKLKLFNCNLCSLSGAIPSLSGLTSLQSFSCGRQSGTNKISGAIPSLSGLTNLQLFRCDFNQLTGTIPSLSGLNKLSLFGCGTNQLSGFAGGSVSNTLGDFTAENNLLTTTAINAILSAFVAANKTTGTRVLNLGGTGNAAPTGQGITDKGTLVSRGWSVTTN